MAQESYRYNSIEMYEGWYRVDISWRTDDADPHHFIDEWTGSIPVQTAGTSTWFDIPSRKGRGRNDNELQMVDTCTFEFAEHEKILACLSNANVSAEIRVWYSPDNTVWHPDFWGIIQLDQITRKREAVVEGVWIKSIQFTAFDGLKKLDYEPFGVYTGMSTTGYLKSGAIAASVGDRDLTGLMGMHGSVLGDVQPRNLVSGNLELMNIRFWLEQYALLAFPEQGAHTTGVDLAYYGYGASPVTSPFSYIAHTNTNATPASIERTFDKLHLFWDVFAAEWFTEFENAAEFLVILAEWLGFSVGTRHTLTATSPSRWVRSLQYARLDGDNGGTLTPAGVLIESSETTGRRMNRRVVVTTRFPSGGHKIDDLGYGTGTIHNLDTYFHTVGAYNIDARNTGPGALLTGSEKTNILWHCLLVEDSSILYRIVNQVKVSVGATTYAFPQITSYDMWDEVKLRTMNGVAGAMAWWYWNKVLGPGERSVIEETYSTGRADNGTTTLPVNWKVYAEINDQEYTSATYKVLEYDYNPHTGELKVTKELS